MYYLIIMVSVVLFGGCFALNDAYQKLNKSSIKSSMQFSLVGSVASVVVLFLINGIRLEFTPFSLLMAALSAINGFLFTFCSFKALGSINLSVYSLFSMLGGMLLPFVQGIAFYDEPITIAKAVGFVLICIALGVTVKQGEKGGTIYYIGVFVLNGMAGVISKIFASSSAPKVSAAGYTVLICLSTFVISFAYLLFTGGLKFKERPSAKSICIASASGATNKLANFLLVIALANVDASLQYPMVTGGVIIVSTVISCFKKTKPNKKELLSVAIAFAGLLALFIIPN